MRRKPLIKRPELLINKQFVQKIRKKSYFSYVFLQFSPFLCQRANPSCCSWLSCYFLKSDREGIAQVALNKRATVSDSLLLLFTKEKHWAICSGRSWKKSNGSILLFFASESLFGSQAICSKKFEKIIFFIWFLQFSPFFAKEWIPPVARKILLEHP